MKLFLNKTSPYARAVRIAAIEKGLSDAIELCWCDPWSDDQELLQANPASKIPVLVTESGVPISESLLIAIYLNELGNDINLISADNKEQILQQAALGQSLMDASFTSVIAEKHMGKAENRSVLGQRRHRVIQRTLQQIESHLKFNSESSLTLGDIVIAVALEYLLFRLPELNTDTDFPALEDWRAKITYRESFRMTSFK